MITYKRYFNSEFFDNPLPAEGGFRGLEAYDHGWFSSVRSTLPALFKNLGIKVGDIVLLPAIAPHGIVLPCRRSRLRIIFYHIDDNFNPDTEYVRSLLKQNRVRALFLIRYFGLYSDYSGIVRFAREQDCLVFEDCAHTLFDDFTKTPFGKTGDISFFSLNKIIPVPDGALFISNIKDLSIKAIEPEESFLNSVAVRAGYQHLAYRTLSMNTSRFALQKKLLAFASKLSYAIYYYAICHTQKPAAISRSTALLLKKLNVSKIMHRRMANAARIAEEMPAGKNGLKGNVTIVTGIPVIGQDAQLIKKKLAEHNIHAMTCNNKWWFVPSSLKREFIREFRLLNNHLLIPANENITGEQLNYLTGKLKPLLENADID